MSDSTSAPPPDFANHPPRDEIAEVIARGVADHDWDPVDWTYLDEATLAEYREMAGPIADAVLALVTAKADPPGPGEGHRRCDCERGHPIDICAECGEDWPCGAASHG